MAKTTDFTNFANERPNYFAGQYLLEDDFEIQHQYLSDRQRYHYQSLHISGIVEGLEVVVIQNSTSVQIKSGSAIDSEGNLIILKEDNTFSDFNNIPDGELYIQYFQDKQTQQQTDVTDSYTRWIEKPMIKFDQQTPQNSVKLAKLTIQGDTINLDPNVREYSGLSLPNSNSKALTLRSGGNANPDLAVLTGSLKIDGDLTVVGTISGKIDTKNITSGTLSDDRIPELSADKITSGILSVDRIPELSADKITSGTLNIDRIPDLSANKITSGTINGSLTVTGNLQCSNGSVTNLLAIGDTPFAGNQGGNRDWMTKGMKIFWDTDNLFIGLKDEGANRKDAVIAWGDDPEDNLRFIYAGNGGDVSGKEVMKLTSDGNLSVTGTINAARVKITQQESWQTPTFENGWVNYDTTYNPAGYFKDSLGIVHLRGLVKIPPIIQFITPDMPSSPDMPNIPLPSRPVPVPVPVPVPISDANRTIFTLPAGYTPSNRELQAVQTDENAIGRLDVLTNGEVVVVSGNPGWLSLDGVTFRAT